jgi:hypothetical protein
MTLQNSASVEEPFTKSRESSLKLGIDKKTGCIILFVALPIIILIVLLASKYVQAEIRLSATATTTTLPEINTESYEKIQNVQAQVMKSYMETSINPCDDFYQYACGNWEQSYQIPQDKFAYSTIQILRENMDSALRALKISTCTNPWDG